MAKSNTALRDDALDLVFGALSHRTRRALLAQLGRGAANVGELAGPHDMSLPAVSKHLRVLERAGLVERSVEGRVHRCSLNSTPMQDAGDWIAERRAFWEQTLDALAAHVEEDT